MVNNHCVKIVLFNVHTLLIVKGISFVGQKSSFQFLPHPASKLIHLIAKSGAFTGQGNMKSVLGLKLTFPPVPA